MSSPFELSDDTPVYVISVAAQLAGLHPQTLRKMCRERDLPDKGSKDVLVGRLEAAA